MKRMTLLALVVAAVLPALAGNNVTGLWDDGVWLPGIDKMELD
jgi:hypothetical protein